MNILFVGVFSKASSTNVSQANAFEKLGHEVKRFDYRTEDNPVARVIVYVDIHKPDLVIFSKCNNFDSEVLRICKQHSKVILWYMDPMHNFDSELIQKVKYADYVCCALWEPYQEAKKYNKNSFFVHEGFDETKIYPINYADVDKLKAIIENIMQQSATGGGQSRSSVSTDKRTSSLLIRDVGKMHEEYDRVIKSIDSPTRQVGIEAKIVEVTTNFTRDLGIQWGILWQPTPQTQVGGTGTGGSGIFSGNPLLVDLPAAVGAGAGGAIGFGYVSAKDLRALDIQLSAMESSGKGRIVSNPKIITMDNQQASIQQGKKIPYQETAEGGGTTTAFVTAALELTVTPHITPDGTIVMDIETKKNEADFSQTSAGGAPTIDTNEASTQVLIHNGDTLVMGGIFKTTTAVATASVPLLSKVPVLGWLFKKQKKTKNTTELLIFITPRIIK